MVTKKKASGKAASRSNVKAALTGTAVATVVSSALQLPPGVQVMRILSLPSLVLKEPGVMKQLLFLSGMKVSNVDSGKKDAEGKPEAKATIADVVDIETGQQFVLLVPAVVESTLLQNYGQPRDDKPTRHEVQKRQAMYDECPIRDLAFLISNRGKAKASQRHVDFTVMQIKAPEKVVSQIPV